MSKSVVSVCEVCKLAHQAVRFKSIEVKEQVCVCVRAPVNGVSLVQQTIHFKSMKVMH